MYKSLKGIERHLILTIIFTVSPRRANFNVTFSAGIGQADYRPGDSVYCTAPGQPAPSFTWRRQTANCSGQPEGCLPADGPVNVTGQTLTMTDQYEGYNSYVCLAYNRVGGVHNVASSGVYSFYVIVERPGPEGKCKDTLYRHH